jgi:pimeloyl-ACP methyl ester carboxylesterase
MLLLLLLVGSTACDEDDERPSKTFVLVHGSWQGAWVWEDLRQRLEKEGQKVTAVDLPAHGQDNTPPQQVSMQAYSDKVIQTINDLDGQVILVGHSMAGAVITAVAEKIPAKIDKLVFIAAYVPANGQSIADLVRTDAQSLLGPNLRYSTDRLLADIVADKRTDVFCQDCPPNKKQFILDHYRSEPVIPLTNPITITPAGFGSVDKHYIHARLDQAVGSDLQNRMIAAAGITQVYPFDTGHSPFLSKPEEVTDLLLDISRK